MVSTRGIRYKFNEGERVLCYEPDPTKAKVLYDSKVLEVIESKDKRGRRTVEYLIHFQGWNSSWDRCVSEDFVLKDTEENRQLQRDLAEKSQLQLGAYLYRRERKKGPSNISGPGPAKRQRHGFSDDGSSTSTQPDEGETADTDSSSGSHSSSQRHSPRPDNVHIGRAHIVLPSRLRDRLTFDYHLVVKRGMLSRLPATPCAAYILESFVKWFARTGAWHTARGRHELPVKPDLLDVSCRLNLVREVVDGLRVYFDFILRGHLLYKQELNQYHEICGKFITTQEEELISELEDEDSQFHDENNVVSAEEDLKSPKMPEYSHLPPDPEDVEKNEELSIELEEAEVEQEPENELEEMQYEMDDNDTPKSDSAPEDNTNHTDDSEKTPDENANLAPSVGSSDSSMSDGWSQPTNSAPAAPTPTRTPISLLLDKVAKWQIIPREGTEHLPCRVYGAIHLSRLFVKLPDFLNASQMPDFKLKLILKHIDMFVQYLDDHSEWFGEMYYIADSMSRSH